MSRRNENLYEDLASSASTWRDKLTDQHTFQNRQLHKHEFCTTLYTSSSVAMPLHSIEVESNGSRVEYQSVTPDNPDSLTRPPHSEKSDTKKGTRINKRVLYGLVGVIGIIAIAIPIIVVMLLRKSDGGAPEAKVGTVDLEVTVQNLQFTEALADPESDEYRTFTHQFCQEMETFYRASSIGDKYDGCLVQELRQGSIIVLFTLVFHSTYLPADTVVRNVFRDNATPTTTGSLTVTVGLYIIPYTESTIVVGQVTIIDNDKNPTPRIGYGQSCFVNEACRTYQAICANKKCGCHQSRRYSVSSDKCILLPTTMTPTSTETTTSTSTSPSTSQPQTSETTVLTQQATESTTESTSTVTGTSSLLSSITTSPSTSTVSSSISQSTSKPISTLSTSAPSPSSSSTSPPTTQTPSTDTSPEVTTDLTSPSTHLTPQTSSAQSTSAKTSTLSTSTHSPSSSSTSTPTTQTPSMDTSTEVTTDLTSPSTQLTPQTSSTGTTTPTQESTTQQPLEVIPSVTLLSPSNRRLDIGTEGKLVYQIDNATDWFIITINKTTPDNDTPLFIGDYTFQNGTDNIGAYYGENITDVDIGILSWDPSVTLELIVTFKTVKCNDGGTYHCSVTLPDYSNEPVVEVAEDIEAYKMRQIQLNLPYDLREGLWGLNIGCTATLWADEILSLMRKIPGESDFIVFVPNVKNEVELRRNETMDLDFPCIKEATYYFDIDLDGWNMTEIRCAINAYTEEEVLSEIGVFRVVPRSSCDGKEAGVNIPHPFNCNLYLTCTTDTPFWSFSHHSNCPEGECWLSDGQCGTRTTDSTVPTTTTSSSTKTTTSTSTSLSSSQPQTSKTTVSTQQTREPTTESTSLSSSITTSTSTSTVSSLISQSTSTPTSTLSTSTHSSSSSSTSTPTTQRPSMDTSPEVTTDLTSPSTHLTPQTSSTGTTTPTQESTTQQPLEVIPSVTLRSPSNRRLDIGTEGKLVYQIDNATDWFIVTINKTTPDNNTPLFIGDYTFQNGTDNIGAYYGENITDVDIGILSWDPSATLELTVSFKTVKCNDGGTYHCSVTLPDYSNEPVVEVVADIEAYKMRQIQLNIPYELREGLWGLNIGCTATLRADEILSLMRKIPGESDFIVFVPDVQNEVELRRNETVDPDFPCIKEATYYFDIDLDGWNMTEIRCAINANTEEEVLSDIGVFRVVPRSACDGKEAFVNTPHPFNCNLYLTCATDTTFWSYIHRSNCPEGECWLSNGQCGTTTTVTTVSTTTTTTTTIPPHLPYISCSALKMAAYTGGEVNYICALRNVDIITQVNIDNSQIVFEQTDDAGLSGTYTDGPVTVMVDMVADNQTAITIDSVTCDMEGDVTITVNGNLSDTVTMRIISN